MAESQPSTPTARDVSIVMQTAESSQFLPKEFVLPNKDQPGGITKTIHTHIKNFHGLLEDWYQLRDKGTLIVRSVSSMKLYEYHDDYYPSQLKKLMENLVEILGSLKHVVEGTKLIQTQLEAISKLPSSDAPAFFTWSANKISTNIGQVYNLLEKEYKLKTIVTENIAHCRDKNLIDVYAASWELDPYLSVKSTAYLFAEIGIPAVKHF